MALDFEKPAMVAEDKAPEAPEAPATPAAPSPKLEK